MQLRIPSREHTQTDIYEFWEDIRSANLGSNSCQLSVSFWGTRTISFVERNNNCSVLQTYDLSQLISNYCTIELDMIDSLSKIPNLQTMLMTRQIGIETLNILESLYEQTEEIIRRKNCFSKIFIFIRELFSRCFDESLKDLIYVAKQNFLSFNSLDFYRVFSESSPNFIDPKEVDFRYIVEEQELIQKISELQVGKKEEKKADIAPTVSSDETTKYRELKSNRGGSTGNITQGGASMIGSIASSMFGGSALDADFKNLVIPESPRMRTKNRGLSIGSFDIKSIGSRD